MRTTRGIARTPPNIDHGQWMQSSSSPMGPSAKTGALSEVDRVLSSPDDTSGERLTRELVDERPLKLFLGHAARPFDQLPVRPRSRAAKRTNPRNGSLVGASAAERSPATCLTAQPVPCRRSLRASQNLQLGLTFVQPRTGFHIASVHSIAERSLMASSLQSKVDRQDHATAIVGQVT